MKSFQRDRAEAVLSALTGLEAALHLVDHVNPALAADQTVVAVTTTQRFQGVTDFHGTNPDALKGRAGGPNLSYPKVAKWD
jgi:hypothetical protein